MHFLKSQIPVIFWVWNFFHWLIRQLMAKRCNSQINWPLNTLLRSTSELLCLNNLVCSSCKLPFWQSYLFWSLSHKRVTLYPFTNLGFPYMTGWELHYSLSCHTLCVLYLVWHPVIAKTCLSLLDHVLEYPNVWTDNSNLILLIFNPCHVISAMFLLEKFEKMS